MGWNEDFFRTDGANYGKETLLLGKCKHCSLPRRVSVIKGRLPQHGAHRSGDAFKLGDKVYEARNGAASDGLILLCPCGQFLVLKPFGRKYNAKKKCNARCMSATGHDCECQCGGKNHGGFWDSDGSGAVLSRGVAE